MIRKAKDSGTRPCRVSGSFYEANPDRLRQSLAQAFTAKFGPRKLETRKQVITAGIAPHAGYIYSGAGAAWVYGGLAVSGWRPDRVGCPGTVAIIGFSHRGHPTGLSSLDWETPLGIAASDREWIERLKNHIVVDDRVHEQEHSIEVQIPFIQYIAEQFQQDIKILCLSVNDDIAAETIAAALRDTEPANVVYIASSDFTHYGHRFGYAPYGSRPAEKMKEVDLNIAAAAAALDRVSFDRILDETGATVCGQQPIRVLIELLKLKQVPVGTVVNYYTSGDVIGEYDDMVGYASIVYETRKIF